MIIDFEKKEKEIEIEVGDVVITECGQKFLITFDTDGDDYRALNLETLIPTEYDNEIEYVVSDVERNFSKVVRVIQSKNLKLTEV